jgi:hypothetical protein
MSAVFVALGLALWRLLSTEGPRAATAIAIFTSVGSGAILINLTLQAGALLVATDPTFAEIGGSEALALLLLDLHQVGFALLGLFFGLWLLPMGYLAYRSQLFPTWLGIVVLAAGVLWTIDPFVEILLPDTPQFVRDLLVAPTAVGEFALVFYLLIVGVRRGESQPRLR